MKTISDFIEELKQYNPNAKITTPYSETIKLSYICDNDGSKETAKIVFIEWADENEEN